MSTSSFTLAMVAGGCAGTSVDVALFPLDTLRTRLQSQDGFWKAGGFRSMYRGILSATLGSAPGAALFFSTYEIVKQMASSGGERWITYACASSCGEAAACLVRVPTAVVTQNMQVGRYRSLSQAVATTFKKGGVREFYRGYGTTVAREVPFSFIQFPLYEAFKKAWSSAQDGDIGPWQGASCGSLAGAIAGTVTTPLDVARTRIMLESPGGGSGAQKYSGIVQTLSRVRVEEGTSALFRGMLPRLVWIVSGGFIFFGAYEQSTSYLKQTPMWSSTG